MAISWPRLGDFLKHIPDKLNSNPLRVVTQFFSTRCLLTNPFSLPEIPMAQIIVFLSFPQGKLTSNIGNLFSVLFFDLLYKSLYPNFHQNHPSFSPCCPKMYMLFASLNERILPLPRYITSSLAKVLHLAPEVLHRHLSHNLTCHQS